MPVSSIQKYLVKKLDLKSEAEVSFQFDILFNELGPKVPKYFANMFLSF